MQRECLRCGAPAADEDRFCSNCGSSLPPAPRPEGSSEVTGTAALQVTDSGPITVVQPGAALPGGPAAFLIVRRGPNEGTSFSLDGDVVTVGRDASSGLFLDDVTVSRRHAEFRRSAEGWTLSDVGSLNGTYVNKDRIESVQLSNGDEVQLGKYRFVFVVTGG